MEHFDPCPVAVRIRGDAYIRPAVSGDFLSQPVHFLLLRIRIRARREIPVGRHLLLHTVKLRHRHRRQYFCDIIPAGTVEGRINHRRRACSGTDCILNAFYIKFPNSLRHCLYVIPNWQRAQVIVSPDLGQNLISVFVGNLSADAVVYLVAVVFLAVVAGGYHYPCITAEVSDGKGKQRHRRRTVKYVCLYTCSCQNPG